MNHEFYMQRCLDLAQLGLAAAAPNPSVGAVLVYENMIIGEGYTAAYGGAHAEVNCLNKVADKQKHLIEKARLYVSLEPCSHFGKTPPCSNLIVREKIPQVIVACLDPNPLVAGSGIKVLQENGVEVITGVCEDEAKDLNKRFFCFHQKKRPYLILKWAQSPLGFFSPNNHEQFWITNKKTKALVHSWRAQEMGILVGANTILSDDPRLNTRLVAGKNPLRIVINTGETLPSSAQIFQDGQNTLVFHFGTSHTNKNVQYVQLNHDESIVQQVCAELYNLNVNSVIIEGGAYTLQEFIKENLWDEARVLVGQNELHEGKLAPKIEASLEEHFEIAEDQIYIYKNSK